MEQTNLNQCTTSTELQQQHRSTSNHNASSAYGPSAVSAYGMVQQGTRGSTEVNELPTYEVL